MIRIYIEVGATNAQMTRIKELIEHEQLFNPNFSGADFEVTKSVDGTYIDGESHALVTLHKEICSILEEL